VEGVQSGGARSRWPVIVTARLPAPVMERLGEAFDLTVNAEPGPMARERLLRALPGTTGALVTSFDRVDEEFLAAAGPGLVMVATFGVGFDHIDVAACTRRGVLVSNTPDVLTETTADLAWAILVATARRVVEGDRFLRTGRPWTWGPEFMLGRDVHHSVLGIVGLGRIGRAVAERARAFDMHVLYAARHRSPSEIERGLGVEYRELEDLLKESDFVSLHVALSEQTRHLIDGERLRMMKPTAVLVNASRGPVVDEAALAEAVRNGTIRAAGLDVFEREPQVHPALLELDNVVLVPHLGSATVDTRTAMGMLAAGSLIAGAEGKRPVALLNPEVWELRVAGLPRQGHRRNP
jgi:glyoxylate reductase